MNELLCDLPAPRDEDLLASIRKLAAQSDSCVVVLDDDPTGTQTVYDTPVLTTWDEQSFVDELLEKDESGRGRSMFYVLTNSRALTESDAIELAEVIGNNLIAASKRTGRPVRIISPASCARALSRAGEPG